MSATAGKRDTPRAGSRDQGRVLLVTDDPVVGAYRELLESAGFNVVDVARGAQALVELGRSRPDVVIADTNLRGIGADELALKLSRAQDSLPLVLVGDAEANGARRSAALTLGAFDYFQLPAERALLMARVEQLASLKQTMDRLRAEADLDYLTGLSNRRRFRNALHQELERWRRYELPCALLLVDIDHLKQINDRHGHAAGDMVICHVATSLAALSRDNDTAARLGGEEFALLLAGADSAKAAAAAERLRLAVCAEPLEEVGTVSVSLGVAACPSHARTERALYSATDAALYRAKHEGRNRTVIAETQGGN
ncbi:MAG TPA: diguanylate cyclase [Pyrinomonadaceae bacterium]|jgi:diguanylate cyclase (GGDEF)-like protein